MESCSEKEIIVEMSKHPSEKESLSNRNILMAKFI
jgi:hypothetical protein